jgi:hypothetical protein
VLVPCFMNWNKRLHTFSIHTKTLFLSNFVHKFVYIPVSEQLSFAKIIHPPARRGISRSSLNINHYTGAPCAGDNKRPLKYPVLSHNTMPQMSQVLRECAIVMLTDGMSTRTVGREFNVLISLRWVSGLLMSPLWTECPVVMVGWWYGQE